jgi:hypothetical protein
MATKKLPVVQAIESAFEDFVSLKDAAYKQAFAGDKAESMVLSTARYTRLHHPNWPHEKDEVVDNLLTEGYLLRFAETKNGLPREYGYVDGNYINVTELAAKPKGTDVLTVAYAVGLSNYDYRMIDNPDKKAVVAEIRDAAKTYVSGNKGRLIKKLEEIDNPDKAKEKKRADNKTFRKHWEDLFEKGDAKVKLAQKLGDPDADSATYKEAVSAFWQVMNRKKK